jgi:hypothetical protein
MKIGFMFVARNEIWTQAKRYHSSKSEDCQYMIYAQERAPSRSYVHDSGSDLVNFTTKNHRVIVL